MSISRSNKLACILVVAMTLASCNLDIPKEVQSSFETMTIEKSDIVLPIKFSAKMKGKADVTITPQVSGQLTKICVTEGQRVGVGTVLFVIDQRNAQHEVEAAQANLQAAQANLQAAIASENSASLEYQSNKNLFDKKIVSTYMLENSLNTYKQAQAAVSQARAAVTQAQASLNRAKVNLGFCTITSPVVGVIGEIPVFAGDQVSPGTQLTIVSGNTTMDAEFSITESFLVNQLSSGTVKEADKSRVMAALPDVQFVLKNGVQYPYGGRVTSLTGVVNAATGSLACKASFPNPDGHLFSGMQGTVVIPIQKKDVMVIPINAVVRLQDKSLVYKVMPDSTAKSVEVTITNTDSGKDVIINSGLNTGDVIVTTGANNVQEGQKVLFPKEEESEKKD
ncbi:MAG: efflux RND transporter periplasmic adaptor subunit [Prevotella sp.]|nr:efflux RND transporter periplasmic adaptor subunit [Prevotella sp.]MBQ4296106.1 efflux RND transporter periplasmic adaptor subunit [Prevotella sp.]